MDRKNKETQGAQVAMKLGEDINNILQRIMSFVKIIPKMIPDSQIKSKIDELKITKKNDIFYSVDFEVCMSKIIKSVNVEYWINDDPQWARHNYTLNVGPNENYSLGTDDSLIHGKQAFTHTITHDHSYCAQNSGYYIPSTYTNREITMLDLDTDN
jgi:hypothetical protein